MRVVLLGGLTAILAGLLAYGVAVLRRPLPHHVDVPDDEPVEPPEAPAERTEPTRRELPTIARPACVARPGRACWRGRIVLPERARDAWQRRLEARRAFEASRRSADGVDDAHVNDSEDATIQTIRCTAENGQTVCSVSESFPDGVTEGDDDEADAAEALPPAGPFTFRFDVTAVPRDDEPSELGKAGDAVDAPEAVDAEVAADGAFEVQVPPGRYDIEVKSDDGFLVGGIDALLARAGEAQVGIDIEVAPALSITGWVVDGDGFSADGLIEVTRTHQSEGGTIGTNEFGAFRAAGLRAGTYRVVTTVEGIQSPALELRAPLDGARLQIRRPLAGILLVGPREGGRCPDGFLILQRMQQPESGWPSARFRDCQAVVERVIPEVTYHATGELGGRAYETDVIFRGTPPAPVCLDPWCGPRNARVRVGAVDANGDTVNPEVLVCDTDPCTQPLPSNRALDPGTFLFLRATDDTLGEGRATIRVVPGVNEVLIRLPGTLNSANGRGCRDPVTLVESDDC